MNSIPLKQCSRKDKCINPLGSWLPATTEYFRKASKEKSGLTARCKACLLSGDAVYRDKNPEHGKQWYEDHKDDINARRRDEYEQDPEKFRKIGRDYYAKHGDIIRQRVKNYRDKHPDKIIETGKKQHIRLRNNPEKWAIKIAKTKQYYIDNPDKKQGHIQKSNEGRGDYKREHARKQYILFPERARAKSHKRMAMKKAVGGSYTDADLKRLYEEQEGRCAYCGISIYWHIPRDIHIDHVQPLSKGGSNNPDNLNLTCHSCNESKADKDLLDWIATRGW